MLMAHILGAKAKIGENEGQIHMDVHSLSDLGVKLMGLVSKYWNKAKKVRILTTILTTNFNMIL